MIKKLQQVEDVMGLAGGKGPATKGDWVTEEECPPNLNLCATVTLKPGSTVGEHTHTGEAEIYHLISGNGEYNDNGTVVPVQAGDVTICYDGEMHGLVNTGKVDLVFYAIIVNG